MRKTKVLSVRLDLATLQSCFDLCEALGHPTKGASGAISRCLTVLLKDLRSKDKLPTYSEADLSVLVAQFMALQNNPTSSISLEKLANLETDFHPVCSMPVESGEYTSNVTHSELSTHDKVVFEQTEQEEYNLLLEEQIRERMKEESNDLLSKIMMGD